MSETPPNDRPDEQPDEQTYEQESPLTEEEERLAEGLDVAGVLADVAADQFAPIYVPDPVATEMAVALMNNGRALEPHMAVIYRYLLGRVANVAVAEDLTQETILAMITGISNHRARRTPTGELDMLAFQSWSLGIARNYALMYFRRERRSRETTGYTKAQMEALGGRMPTPEEELALSESLGNLFNDWAKKAGLTHRQYTVLWMHEVMGRSIKEIANELGMTEGTVRAIMLRGRNRLAGWLAQNGYADWVDEDRKRSRGAR